MANEKTQQILDLVKGLTILELADLVKALEEEFGVSAAPVAVAAAPGAAAAAPAVEEKTEFDVELTSYDEAAKLKVIKEVKDITGLSLSEAKELVTSAPKAVKTGVSKEEAEKIKAQLEAAGAKVTVK
ncbi:MAG TPA: 50S ribosomal protein L7/L12 [Bacillota bacterium]|nr:50S ribosomal protein L7/L12 [Bacillota bacterium]HOK68882.1 50S ribosomal protein L7/L12 [Bacillota bacterium]HPP84687.1 50S ribosomal protein L7/L12 [Bacillota bacterium]